MQSLQFKAIETIAKKNPMGFTVNKSTLQPITSGFAVSIKDTQNSFGHEGLRNVLQFVEQSDVHAIGGWYNSENGQFYFDATAVYADKETAIKVAKENNQIAIFDLDTLSEIRL